MSRGRLGVLTIAWLAACDGDDEPAHDGGLDDARPIDASPIDATTIDAAPRAAVLVDCADVTGLIQHTAEVTDAQKGYVPTGDATIDVGHVVKWGYAAAGTAHSITSVDGFFDSGLFTEHGTFICVRFDAPGDYPYRCSEHPNSAEQAVIHVP